MTLGKTAQAPKPRPGSKSTGSLVNRVYEQLESMIVTLQLPPGSLLSEVELGNQLGVSRTPVGEALQRLAREGLVTVLPRRGIVVTEISVSDQLRLLELRREISRFIARMGARRASLEERTRLRCVAQDFQKAADDADAAALMRADKEFHDLFATCAHNRFACTAIDSMDALSRRFWYAHNVVSGDFPQSAKLHANIALAIAEGNEVAAVTASDALTDYLENFARGTLDQPRAVMSMAG